jgi:hypothetical protein
LTRFRAAIQSGQPQVAAHFVNKDELLTLKSARELPKLGASLFIALTGDETFFSEGGSELVNFGKSWTD